MIRDRAGVRRARDGRAPARRLAKCARGRPAARSGSALIEVLIALVLLAMAGTGLVIFLGQTAHTLRHVRDEERLIRLASAELDRMTLWDRPTFIARTGRSRVASWTVHVRPLTTELFDISIAASDTGAVLLRTIAYRPDTIDAGTP
jgi:Tfp pilus assembly protein PilV